NRTYIPMRKTTQMGHNTTSSDLTGNSEGLLSYHQEENRVESSHLSNFYWGFIINYRSKRDKYTILASYPRTQYSTESKRNTTSILAYYPESSLLNSSSSPSSSSNSSSLSSTSS
ncbi:hypothetical protein PIB30_088009, partial [Stylosanthes scabra]|nr:hypothetical protein [Stylosanthes scabra]